MSGETPEVCVIEQFVNDSYFQLTVVLYACMNVDPDLY